MVDGIKPHRPGSIIGLTESWANNDITDAELGPAGYVMFVILEGARASTGLCVDISIVQAN